MAASDDHTAEFHARMPFARTLGLQRVYASREQVGASVALDEAHATGGGIMHGGVIMGLADSVGGYCAMLNLPSGASGTATIESKTNFLRAIRAGSVHAVARPLHIGRSVIVVDTELRDDDGRLVARTTQTQAVLTPS
jgi:1,4-dihydroxy-2-naphthoyl-CoA hydrolase